MEEEVTKCKKNELQAPRFTRKDILRLILPLIVEQLLAVTIGMADSVMVASSGEAAVSSVSLVDSINVLLIQIFAALATGGAILLSLALLLSVFSMTASAATMVDFTQEITLRVGESVQLTNPSSNSGMAFSAYSWSIYGQEVVSESHAPNSATASVTALQPGRAIVIGYLDGCYPVEKQISSSYNDDTHTWDKFHYTDYSENYAYIYRFHITVLNADGSSPAGPSFAQLTAQMEADAEAEAEEAANVASGTCGANVTWTYDHGTLTIGGTGKMKDYGKYDRQPWYGYDIEKVVIRDGVTHIGSYAFSSGAAANRFETIRSISIAGSVKDVGDYAFCGCTALETAVFSEGLASIGDYAFSQCPLKVVLLPGSVTEIGENAFAYCDALASVYLPSGLKTISGYAFAGCTSLTSVVVPESVTSLGRGVFENCSALQEAVILGRVKALQDWVFSFCPSLETIYIPSSVTSVETFAFDVTESMDMVIYYEGSESQWKQAAYDDIFRRWNLPDDVTTHYNCVLPDMPEPSASSTDADLDALAAAAIGTVNKPDSASNQVTAYEMPQTIRLDNREVTLTTYALLDQNGNVTNYAKLRDIAVLLSGTAAQFEVGWNQVDGILLIPGAVYTPDGSESSTPFHGTRNGVCAFQTIRVSGNPVQFETLTLTDDAGGGYNYLKLRDLGQALGFNVRWDGGVVIESDKPYSG